MVVHILGGQLSKQTSQVCSANMRWCDKKKKSKNKNGKETAQWSRFLTVVKWRKNLFRV